MWKLFDTGVKTAEDNMALDAKLLEELDPAGPAILHLYGWKWPSATYGYFIKPNHFLNLDATKRYSLSLARRPTGGGIIFHLGDLAFSALVPAEHPGFSANTLENYRYINHKVIVAIQSMLKETSLELLPWEQIPLDRRYSHFCMAKPTIFDVMIEGKKVAGAAQRKRRQGFLHQGSISIALPEERLLRELLLPEMQVLEAMKSHTYTILQSPWSKKDLDEIREMLKKHLTRVFLEGSV